MSVYEQIQNALSKAGFFNVELNENFDDTFDIRIYDDGVLNRGQLTIQVTNDDGDLSLDSIEDHNGLSVDLPMYDADVKLDLNETGENEVVTISGNTRECGEGESWTLEISNSLVAAIV